MDRKTNKQARSVVHYLGRQSPFFLFFVIGPSFFVFFFVIPTLYLKERQDDRKQNVTETKHTTTKGLEPPIFRSEVGRLIH